MYERCTVQDKLTRKLESMKPIHTTIFLTVAQTERAPEHTHECQIVESSNENCRNFLKSRKACTGGAMSQFKRHPAVKVEY